MVVPLCWACAGRKGMGGEGLVHAGVRKVETAGWSKLPWGSEKEKSLKEAPKSHIPSCVIALLTAFLPNPLHPSRSSSGIQSTVKLPWQLTLVQEQLCTWQDAAGIKAEGHWSTLKLPVKGRTTAMEQTNTIPAGTEVWTEVYSVY